MNKMTLRNENPTNFFESLHKEEWREVRLGEAPIQIIDGDRGKNYPKQNELFKSGYCLFLNTKNVPHSRFDFSECQFIDNVKDELLRKGKLQINDIILTTRGTIGNLAFYNEHTKYKHIRINSGMVIMRPNIAEMDSKFFFYAMLCSKNMMRNLASGSAQPQLPIKDLSNLKIPLPPLPIQNQIAEILSSFDDKIDLLHRQNQTLESLALTLFRHHFIKNPNRNEWKIGKLGDYGKIVCGKTPSKNKKEYFNGEIPFIKIPDMHNKTFVFKTTDSLTQKGLQSQHTKTLPPLSICVSCIATVGVVSMNAFESQTNQQINSIIPAQEYYRYFLYCFMKESYNELQAMASGGTATANLNTTDFSNMPILCPNDMELQKFHSSVSVYFDKIYNNSKQIQSLEQMRDLVLSKIFSGKMEE